MTTVCSTYQYHYRICNEEGYLTLHGYSRSCHFFERDYLGNVRAVVNLYGNHEQDTNYNVTGIPSSRHLGTAEALKHTGKDFFDLQGAGWYDNHARYYDCLLGRFTSQDPLAEKYPGLNPYNHCANNPVFVVCILFTTFELYLFLSIKNKTI